MDVVRSAAEIMLPEARNPQTGFPGQVRGPATTVGELLLAAAREHGDRPAVIAARRDLTHRELVLTASALASQIAAPAPVGICVEPGWEQVVAVAAAAMAGSPWFVLDPSAPRSAHWHRLAELGSTTVLTQSWLATRTEWPEGTAVLEIDRVIPVTELPARAGGRPESPACFIADEVGVGGDLATVSHDGVVAPLLDLGRRLELGADDRLLAVSLLGDALGASQLYLPLLTGGAVVVPDDIDLRTPAAWVELMRAHHVTVWHAAPGLTALLAEHLVQRGDDRPDGLRAAVLGGEPVQAALVRWLRRGVGTDLTVVGVEGGGPAGLWITWQAAGESDGRQGVLPAGTTLGEGRAVVLGETLDVCPTWVPGRLHVGPHGDGTLVATRWTARQVTGGVLEILGDDSTRVTVSGHALNLREVESAIATHEDVLAAAVVPAGDNTTAYVKAAPGRTLTGAAVLDHLRGRMSPYLLPGRLELVGAFPLDRWGRIDRQVLARQAAPAEIPPARVAPTSPARGAPPADLVRQACALAARILGVADVEPDLNLLDVGASSVQLVQLAVQAEAELGIQADVEELLRFPSVGVLVSFAADTADAGSTPDEPDRERPELIVDPVARSVFTDNRPGLRQDMDEAPGVALPDPTGDPAALARRRTRRRFARTPVPVERLAELLGCLRRVDGLIGGTGAPRHAYPSAGSLYPVRVYLTVPEGRVEGVEQGAYYYHPDDHRLVRVGPSVPPEAAHAWVNREAARSSAFALYLVAHLPAIEPLYGARARDYCLFEAGAITQLLMGVAVGADLGLCPVGELDGGSVGGSLGLGASDEIVHTLLGGTPAEDDESQAGMLGRLAGLRGGGR
ncbi:AMP-binding protein [Modestobacter sp. I12A-02628]|uniref:AMP-binding protein n=1 Tax=Goekera deserti TaxID=2497753 RepID=A0A7K3WFS3_9ACTN|nr:AMP-binding protein [Goekera deserti]MPQ96913.1 AMP-binding protein [Goekera deserti]NDI46774.1 AMP-binding protein [Goekera deserti]NEL54343.1 AMP-binding protein [Goekera deserti]